MKKDVFYLRRTVCAKLSACVDGSEICKLWKSFTFSKSRLQITAGEKNVLQIGEISACEIPVGRSYAVRITDTGIFVAAADRLSLIRGILSVIVRIEFDYQEPEKFFIRCQEYTDYYSVRNRMIHFCVFPETTLTQLKKLVRLAAVLQYTHIILEFWGMLRYESLKELSWAQAYDKSQIEPVIRQAGLLGCQVVPMFNMLGHASASRVCGGKHVVLDQDPSLYHLFTCDGWAWNIFSKQVRQLHRNIRSELYELFGAGEYFHIGCDEDYQSGYPEFVRGCPEYLRAVTKEILSEGRRPILWGDMLLCRNMFDRAEYICLAREEKNAEELLAGIAEEAIIADWQYQVKDIPVKTSVYLKNKGFDTLICPWDDREVQHAAVQTCLHSDLYGVMLTTWHTLNQSHAIAGILRFAQMLGAQMPIFCGRSDPAAETAALLRRIGVEQSGDYSECGWISAQVVYTP